ncbi:MAG: hypothetical protein Q8M15_06885 [Bacteroidota bacterium]|nr:hypothetical protein [Bacteroidota bacterium]
MTAFLIIILIAFSIWLLTKNRDKSSYIDSAPIIRDFETPLIKQKNYKLVKYDLSLIEIEYSGKLEFIECVNLQKAHFSKSTNEDWTDIIGPVMISNRILSFYDITINQDVYQMYITLVNKFVGKMGRRSDILSSSLQSKYTCDFSVLMKELIKNLTWLEKIYLFDVINTFKYKKIRQAIDKELSWYHTRLMGINETDTNKILFKHNFLIASDSLEDAIDFITKKELKEIFKLSLIEPKKSWNKNQFYNAIIQNEITLEMFTKKFKELKLCFINPSFNSDIEKLVNYYQERITLSQYLWLKL